MKYKAGDIVILTGCKYNPAWKDQKCTVSEDSTDGYIHVTRGDGCTASLTTEWEGHDVKKASKARGARRRRKQ